MAPEVSTVLEPDRYAPASARSFVRRALEMWDLDDVEELADLLTSELVTNAVEHGRCSQIVLRVAAYTSVLRVEVGDEDPERCTPVKPDPNATRGRGLFIVPRRCPDHARRGTPLRAQASRHSSTMRQAT